MASRKKTSAKAAKKTARKPATKTTAKRKPAKKKPAAKKTPARKPATTSKPTPARAAPAAKWPRLKKPPVLWRLTTSTQAAGLWVDEEVWAGNENGEVFALSKDGEVLRSFLLPDGVDSLIADEMWKYAGCADGKVYDLTGRVARAMYEIGHAVQIDWMEMWRGTLCVSDDDGGLFVVDAEGNERWKKTDKKAKEGWMVRVDGDGLYHGSMMGLRHFDWTGKLVWHLDHKKVDDVRFGWWVDLDRLVCITGFSRKNATWIRIVDKSGHALMSAPVKSDADDFSQNGAESCGAGKNAAGDVRLYASTGGYLFCYDEKGACLWETELDGMGSACTMQIADERLYMVTSEGAVACLDVSDAAVERAQKAGGVPKVRATKLARLKQPSVAMEETTDAAGGVVVECVKEGSKVRVKVVSDGYNGDWFVQFPRDLREEGARFVVEQVLEATQGGFYRVRGDIKRLR